jgi:cytoskeletal protein CcmA (bactofilin family)
MADQITTKPEEFATIIGQDAQFKGELTFQGGVRIDGQFEGSITTSGKIFVTKGGRLRAEVRAGSLAVEGTIDGNVQAEDRVELRATCTLRGDLKAAKLLVVEGATFVGRCEVGPAASQVATTAPKSAAEIAGMASIPAKARH